MFNLDTNKRIVILSAEQAGKSAAANANASDVLRTTLSNDLMNGHVDSVLACDGQYKGAPERSFLVICDADTVPHLTRLAGVFDQECVLVGVPVSAGWITGFLRYPDSEHDINIGALALCVPGREYDASTTIHGTGISFHFE